MSSKEERERKEKSEAARKQQGKRALRPEEIAPTSPRQGHETVDMVSRPGPGERQDAERPRAPHDSEEQNGGRSVEEELAIQPNDDDAGGLPNQQISNRGPLPTDEGRDLPVGDD